MQYAQGDTHFPHFQEPSSELPDVWCLIGNKYGQLWDFSSQIFRTSGGSWVKKSGEMTRNDSGLWTYNLGWTVPSGINVFHLLYRDKFGTHYPGESLNVSISGSGGSSSLTANDVWSAATRTLTSNPGLTNTDIQNRLNEYGAVRPTVSGRLVTLNATGHVGLDWSNIANPTNTNSLTGTSISSVITVSTLGIQAKSDVKGQVGDALNADNGLKAGVSGRLLDVSAGGEAGIDWSNVGSPTSTVALTNTSISGVSVLTDSQFNESTAVLTNPSTLKDRMVWLSMLARNKITQDSGIQRLYRDDGTTQVGTSSVSDDGTTFTRGEWT